MRKCICLILLIFLILQMLVSCSPKFEEDYQEQAYIEFLPIEDEVSLVSVGVLDFLNGEKSAKEVYDAYSNQGSPYKQMLFSLHWSIYNIPLNEQIEKMIFSISTDKDLKQVENITLADSKRSVVLKDLYVDTDYFCELTVFFSNGNSISEKIEFKTKATPRILTVEGVYGLRDIGGVKNSSGIKLKQGMVYRGSEIDGVKSERYTISQEGIDFFINDLKITSEFDLRGTTEKNTKNALGETVTRNIYNIYAYSDSLTKDSHEGLRKCFGDLAVAENYPIYIHCSYGKDRTGTVVYLLQILCGVSEEDAYREWELSALMDGVHFYDGMDDFIRDLKALDGDNMQEKVTNYLLSIGVLQSEIDSIKSIMIESK